MQPVRRILVPVDFSPCSRAALLWAHRLATDLNAQIDLLHVWEPLNYSLPEVMVYRLDTAREPLEKLARSYAESELKRFLDSLEGSGQLASQRLLESDNTAEAICEVARCEGHGLVVMGTHGRRGLSRWVRGSVAEDVIRQAACPVITVRSEEVP